jgi:hypothetical protein
MPDFAFGVLHGEKRFAEMAQHFEMAQQKCVQRFAVFDRSAVGPLRSPSPPNRAGFASLAYVAGIHVFTACVKAKTWMAGTSPAMTVGYARSALLEPHPGLIAVGEYDAGFFQGVPDDVDSAGLQRFAGFETYDGASRDLRHFRKLAHGQFQSGSRHAALGGIHRYSVSSLT